MSLAFCSLGLAMAKMHRSIRFLRQTRGVIPEVPAFFTSGPKVFPWHNFMG